MRFLDDYKVDVGNKLDTFIQFSTVHQIPNKASRLDLYEAFQYLFQNCMKILGFRGSSSGRLRNAFWGEGLVASYFGFYPWVLPSDLLVDVEYWAQVFANRGACLQFFRYMTLCCGSMRALLQFQRQNHWRILSHGLPKTARQSIWVRFDTFLCSFL